MPSSPPLRIEDRSSFFGAAEPDIKGDALLDPAASAAVPLRADGADEAEPRSRRPRRHPHREPAQACRRRRPNAAALTVRKRRFRTQNEQVRAGVASGDACRGRGTRRGHDFVLVAIAHRLLRSDDRIRLPQRRADVSMRRVADRDREAARRARSGASKCLRKTAERIGFGSHGRTMRARLPVTHRAVDRGR